MHNLVGYRFHPTDQELIDYYLFNKIMGTNTRLIHEAISEIDIYSQDPWNLYLQSKISSNDPVWYFFSVRDIPNGKKKGTKRTTTSGYWKATGVDRKVKRKGSDVEIGSKKTLVFYKGRVPHGERTHWVIHEYHASSSSPGQRTYVICKVKFKGAEEDMMVPSNRSEPSQSIASNLNNVQEMNTVMHHQVQETPESFYGIYENDLEMPLNEQAGLSLWELQSQLQSPYQTQTENEFPVDNLMHQDHEEDLVSMFDDPDPSMYSLMQENRNNYTPLRAYNGVYVIDYSSGSDADSVSATSYQETLSPVISEGSSNGHNPADIGEILSLGNYTRGSSITGRALEAREVVVDAASKKEIEWETEEDAKKTKKKKKKGWVMMENAIEESRRHPPYVYITNTVIGFIVFVAVICDLLSIH